MTRPIPSKAHVLAALTELQDQAQTTGRPPSTLALARRVGLANTTFRRHFPAIAAQLSPRTSGIPAAAPAETTRYDALKTANASLRTANRELRENLELAIASIQRLTLENSRLRHELEATAKITRMPRTRN